MFFYFLIVISKFLNRNRNISTSQLNTLLCLHLKPINLIISQGSITIPNLEAGFPLRCFQRLSIPDIATEQCPWQDSSYTRGQFTSVLSSHYTLFLGVQTISSPFFNKKLRCWRITSISLSRCTSGLSSVMQVHSDTTSEISRYGVKPKILHNSLFVFFFL